MATEFVTLVAVRLTAQDLGVLHDVSLPTDGSRAETYRRVAREAVLPSDILVRYRKLPLFPDWTTWGPFSPVAADSRGRHLITRGFEVEVQQVEPRVPAAMWDDEVDDEVDDEACDGDHPMPACASPECWHDDCDDS